MSVSAPTHSTPRRAFVPTLNKQCWGFMIGSTFFALGSAPGLSEILGSAGSNLLFFIGAWFFTGAGLIQVFLSGPISVPVSYHPGRMVRAEWLTASTQSFGTLMFNVSTTAALYAKSVGAQDKYVWAPDAGGSVAFLVSGVVGFIAYAHVARHWDFRHKEWWSVLINFIGCVAFGFSAIGAYVLPGGDLVNTAYATWGTFIGAICFFLTSFIVLPFWSRHRRAAGEAAS
ncbi:hypothetical protein GCM10009816_04940 [Microbacterium aquimaris]